MTPPCYVPYCLGLPAAWTKWFMARTSISNSYVRSLSVSSGAMNGLEEGVDANDDVEGEEGEDRVILDERSYHRLEQQGSLELRDSELVEQCYLEHPLGERLSGRSSTTRQRWRPHRHPMATRAATLLLDPSCRPHQGLGGVRPTQGCFCLSSSIIIGFYMLICVDSSEPFVAPWYTCSSLYDVVGVVAVNVLLLGYG